MLESVREHVLEGKAMHLCVGSGTNYDEAFLAISCAVLYFLVPSHLLFSLADGVGISVDATNEWIKGGVQVIFIVSTLIVAVWTAILYLLLLHRPQILGWCR